MKKLNNKGFAITTVAYTLLVFFILLIMLMLLLLRNLDTSLSTLNKNIKDSINNIKYLNGIIEFTGDVHYGETLTAIPTITNLSEDEKVTYTYQWYTNDTEPVKGTAISGSTSNKLILKAAQYNKYICVEVTASSDNYDDATFNACTSSPVAKRPIVVTAGSSSKVYDGTALTNSTCTASNLGFAHTVKCTMTPNSTITSVGSVNNEISSVSVYNDSKNGTVNTYYDITLVKGTLTVTSS